MLLQLLREPFEPVFRPREVKEPQVEPVPREPPRYGSPDTFRGSSDDRDAFGRLGNRGAHGGSVWQPAVSGVQSQWSATPQAHSANTDLSYIPESIYRKGQVRLIRCACAQGDGRR